MIFINYIYRAYIKIFKNCHLSRNINTLFSMNILFKRSTLLDEILRNEMLHYYECNDRQSLLSNSIV